MRFGATVTSAVYDEPSGTWTRDARRRHRASGPGSSSPRPASSRCRTSPTCPGATTSAGEQHHTGRWPADAGRLRRQARRRHRHRIERRADHPGHRRRGRLADRVPAHRQLVHAAQQRADHARGAGAAPGRLRGDPRGAEHVGRTGSSTSRTIAPPSTTREDERQAFFEKMWNSPGFSKLTSNYTDLLFDPAANAEWCEFIAEKIRGIVEDPETAEKLIPKDHRFGEKRPPFVTGYYEAYNNPNVSLVDLEQTPIVRVTETRDRDGRRRARARHHRVGDRLRLRHRRARRAWGSAAATASRSTTTGPTARRRSSASRPPASRTSSSPAGRTRRPATTRGTTATRSTSSPTRSSTLRDHGYDTIEVDPAAEERWTDMIDTRRGRRRRSGRAATTSAPTSPGSRAGTS